MKSTTAAFLLAAALAGTGTLQAATFNSSSHDSATVRAAIDAGNANWSEAFRTQNVELILDVMCEDGALLGREGVTLGKEAIRKELSDFMQTLGPADLTIETLQVWLLDDLAFEVGKYEYKYTDRETGQPGSFDGRYYEIWRYENGSWKVWRDTSLPK